MHAQRAAKGCPGQGRAGSGSSRRKIWTRLKRAAPPVSPTTTSKKRHEMPEGERDRETNKDAVNEGARTGYWVDRTVPLRLPSERIR